MSDIAKTMFWSLAIVGIVVLAFAPKIAKGQEGRHGEGHAQNHDIYKNWRIPTNPMASCCHDQDCRPTRAFVGDDGLWRAWEPWHVQATIALGNVVALMHFWYDGFVWSVQKRQV